MRNTFGNNLSVTLFGESHGEAIGAVIDGIVAGTPIDEEYIREKLTLRRPSGAFSTARAEEDSIRFVSGVYRGRATGTPICILISNTDIRSADYDRLAGIARPGHADYTGYVRYDGFNDPRGGGHFSGRITAAWLAAGAIAQHALEENGVFIGTHILECGRVIDRNFGDYKSDIDLLSKKRFATLDCTAEEKMKAAICSAANDGDSVGGILETAIVGVEAGVGEPWFDTVEGLLSHALFAIPAVKGVEFGDGFALARMKGSEANDAFALENRKTVTKTNHAGGINGGITNGMPIIFRCAVKPTSSIAKVQQTVNFLTGEQTELSVGGRHDPCIVHRARAVVDGVAALVIYDLLLSRYGEKLPKPSDES